MGFGSDSTGRALAVTLSTLLALLATQALAHGDDAAARGQVTLLGVFGVQTCLDRV